MGVHRKGKYVKLYYINFCLLIILNVSNFRIKQNP